MTDEGLKERIITALWEADEGLGWNMSVETRAEYEAKADAVLAALPPPDDEYVVGVRPVGEYDPLMTLRRVKQILDPQEHTKRGLRQQRTDAILAMAGTLGYHDALALRAL